MTVPIPGSLVRERPDWQSIENLRDDIFLASLKAAENKKAIALSLRALF